MGKNAPPDLMESLGFGPLETDDDPYWTEAYGPVHAHPNLWPDGMPEFRAAISTYWRAMDALAMHLSRIFALRSTSTRNSSSDAASAMSVICVSIIIRSRSAHRSKNSCAPARTRTMAPSRS